MNRLSMLITFFVLTGIIFADSSKWILERSYKDNKLFLHALINYRFNPQWNYLWEKNRIKGNGFRLITGSVSTNDLLIDGQLVINQNLGSGWYFLNYSDYYATRHHNTEEQSVFLGFEKIIKRNFSAFMLVDPSFDKEFTDVNIGFSLTGNKRENYFRIALSLDDLVYESKNNLGGKSDKNPLGVKWLIRYKKNKWCFFSEGKYSSAFKRNYNDPELSPVMNFHQQQINEMKIKLYYHKKKTAIFELSFNHYHFMEKMKFYESQNNYLYTNYVNNLAIKHLYSFNKKNRINIQAHYLWKDAESNGYRTHDFLRKEFLPAIFYEYLTSKNTLTFGFLSTFNSWEYESKTDVKSYIHDGFLEKVLIGWTYHFNEKTKFQLSLSHELEINNFGGGSVQYVMLF